MKLLRLYVHNCGIFQNTLIDFTHDNAPQNMLCLAGVNGSGKTTIMELIFNIFNFMNPELSLQNISFDRLKPNILTRTDFAQLDISVEKEMTLSLVLGDSSKTQKDTQCIKQGLIIENEIKTIISQFENNVVKIPEGGEDPSIEIKFKGIREVERFLFRSRLNREVKKENLEFFDPFLNKIKKAFSDEDIDQNNKRNNLPFVYFFNAHDREIQDIRYASVPKEKQEYQIAHRYNPKRDDLKKTLIYYDYAHQDKFEELKNWVNQHILIGKQLDKINRPNFQVIIKTSDGRNHDLELLSSGEESLLIIATQLYLRASKNAIFLIDEIDQSLHPEFQEKAIKLLFQLQKDKGCQIIVSSHSEIIWNAFKDKGLIDLTEMVI